jgi:hypothetical protein
LRVVLPSGVGRAEREAVGIGVAHGRLRCGGE